MPLKSTIVTGSRTAAAGSGVQSITGAGFTPKAAVVLFTDTETVIQPGTGFVDDAGVSAALDTRNLYPIRTPFIYQSPAGGQIMEATGALTADGIDLTWTKTGSGSDVYFSIMFLG